MSLEGYREQAEAHRTATNQGVALFLCPSDTGRPFTGINYASNWGVWEPLGPRGGLGPQSIALAEITDGTSQTVGMAEQLLGRRPGEPRDERHEAFSVPIDGLRRPQDFPLFISSCRGMSLAGEEPWYDPRGHQWIQPGYTSSAYNHANSINGRSCRNYGLIPTGAWTAASAHQGGVFALFADGHAAFVRDTLAVETWRALGTRDGGEAIGSSEGM
jgi:prepilin-type processing-associated H-X9-DG protein